MEGQTESPKKPAQPESGSSLLYNLLFNLFLPILILGKGGEWFGWDPKMVLIVALNFPIWYGVKDLVAEKRINWFSVLGLVSVLLKGMIGLLQLSPFWVAVNEAALPLVIGIAVLASSWMRKPFGRTILFQEALFDMPKVRAALQANDKTAEVESYLRVLTRWLAGTFLFSAIMNVIMARIFVKTHPAIDAEKFNTELAAMQGWSYLFISVPAVVVILLLLWVFVGKLSQLTGLTTEEMFVESAKGKNSEK